MRIYIAGKDDTLRRLACLSDAALEDLLLLNPQLTDPDANIDGHRVKLPPRSVMPDKHSSTSAASRQTGSRNEWIPLASLEDMAKTDYDVLIVGSGAGGGAVLWRLCEQWRANGKKIGVVEAGDLMLPTHFYNIPTMSLSRYEAYFGEVSTRIPPQFREVIAFGGRTLLWGAAAPRMSLSELARWPVPVGEMDYYYSIAERIMQVAPSYGEGSYFTQMMLDRLQERGYPQAEPLPIAADREPTKYGQVHSNVFFSSIALFASALNRRPFDLAVNSRAVRILTEQNRAAGVRVMSADKQAYDIRAKTVVLSASTFETPRLLLASGIPGRAIGHYLTDSSVVAGRAAISRRQFPEVLGLLGIRIPGGEGRPYQMILDGPTGYFAYQQYMIEPLQDKLEFNILAFGVVESSFDNRIELLPAEPDEYGVPRIRVHFSYNEKDKMVIRQMESAVTDVYSALAVPGETTAPIRYFPLEAVHDAGTCRMGADPETSVTDTYGQIHGIAGLYVADNSVQPFSITANPTLTTAALALRTADHIIRR